MLAKATICKVSKRSSRHVYKERISMASERNACVTRGSRGTFSIIVWRRISLLYTRQASDPDGEGYTISTPYSRPTSRVAAWLRMYLFHIVHLDITRAAPWGIVHLLLLLLPSAVNSSVQDKPVHWQLCIFLVLVFGVFCKCVWIPFPPVRGLYISPAVVSCFFLFFCPLGSWCSTVRTSL